MASLAFLFGMIPSTEKVEAADDKIRADFAAYKEFEQSNELKHFLQLENEVNSADFSVRKKKILKENYKASEEYQKEKELKALRKKAKKEDKPDHLVALEKEINSEEFKQRVSYLKMKPKERYETTEEFKKEKEYNELKKSDKIVWYFKTKKKYPFSEIEQWEQTFNESFENGKLDDNIWMTRYFWGDAILDEPYTMADDKSFPTDGKNIEFKDKKLRIVGKKEEVEGKKWDPVHGFLIDTFDFTSGLISTGKGFRQKYGLFKAKIRMSSTDMTQAFWMVSDSILPHIDIAKIEKGKLYSTFFQSSGEQSPPEKSITKTGGSRYSQNFYIFSLEWSPNSLVWKINDKVFKTVKTNIPDEEMYMVFSTGLKNWAKEAGLPGAMEIDWVRVYRKIDQN